MTDLWPLLALACLLAAAGFVLALRDWRWGALLLAAALPFEGLLPATAGGMKAIMAAAGTALTIHLARKPPLLARLLANLRADVSLGLLAFTLLCALSSAWALSVEAALGRALTFLGLFLLVQLFALLDADDVRRAWTVLLASAAATVPVGLLFADVGAFSDEGRFSAGGLNPNDYAGLLLVVLLTCGLDARGGAGRVLKAAAAAIVLLGIVWSGSRTALVALAAAPLLHLAFCPPAARTRALLLGAVAYAAVGATLLGVYSLDRPRAETLQARALTLADYRSEDTWTGRLELWRGAVEMVGDHPALGIGAGNFPVAAPRYTRLPRRADDAGGRVAHNVFLGLAAEVGAAGCALFAFVAWRALRRARALSAAQPLGSSLLLGLVAYFVMGLALSWEYHKVGYLLIGSLLALSPPRMEPAA